MYLQPLYDLVRQFPSNLAVENLKELNYWMVNQANGFWNKIKPSTP